MYSFNVEIIKEKRKKTYYLQWPKFFYQYPIMKTPCVKRTVNNILSTFRVKPKYLLKFFPSVNKQQWKMRIFEQNKPYFYCEIPQVFHVLRYTSSITNRRTKINGA